MCIGMIFSFLFLFVLHGLFGDDADEVKSVMEGDSVTLHTDVTELQTQDYIVWVFGPQDTRIAEIYKKSIDMYDSNDTFRDRLKLDSEIKFLTITHMRISDSGLYKLQIISNRGTSYKRFNVTVYARLPVPVTIRNNSVTNMTDICGSCSDHTHSLSETVIRLVIAAVVGVAALTLALFELRPRAQTSVDTTRGRYRHRK